MEKRTFKVNMGIDEDVLEKEMKRRGIKIHETNKRKFIRIIQGGSFTMKVEAIRQIPDDREMLLMKGIRLEN